MSDSNAFFDLVREALQSGTFVKATLSRPWKDAPVGLRNLFLRPVEIRRTPMVAWTFRHERRDEVKNLTAEETLERLHSLCGPQWRNTDVFTTANEATLTHNRRGEPAVFIRPAAQTAAPDTQHDRTKSRLLDPGAPWLQALGITNTSGMVLPSSQAKWRQINKFIEIIASLLRTAQLPEDAHIADMGCGKGYLTFALYDYLTKQTAVRPHITGVEMRPELVAAGNALAKRAGFDGLTFAAGTIQEWSAPRLDMLIALHACDTATDEALAAGVKAAAQVIVAAPCCHKQVRHNMHPVRELAALTEHGILAERQAELLTDALRALLLETRGYETAVFEFISTEHTAKNVMITAVRHDGKPSAKAEGKISALKEAFGLTEHRLETMLSSIG
jgi:SAM-dependent methyltransferase